MTSQPFPPVPQESNEPNTFPPSAGGSSRVNFGTENHSYVVNNYYAAPQPSAIPPLQPQVWAVPPVERDYKGRTRAAVRKRRTWAWVGLIIGGMVIFGSIVDFRGVLETLSGLMIGAAMVVPGAWWLRCERQDRRALAEWEERVARNRELKQMLGGEYDAVVRGMGEDRRPAPMDRKWPIVAALAVALLIVGGLV
ncbi:hypothetical protein [Corynebacterium timonense]|uniref:Uncharacterized protein n=1 Tax=Corynebacterium timonense TaxID=441500 RepID=A0A1H1M9B0_9CORY|nr:hypothetical protein [Corynebacterium timonense]SDR82985.1 hypothetical protein SAMN04488539_0463 [Corynebacterium timonense]